MQSRSGSRLRHFISIALLAVATCFWGASQAQQKTAAPADRPKIRAITAFINLDRAQYQQQVADALKMLRRAQTTFESRGYQVQAIRRSGREGKVCSIDRSGDAERRGQ